MERKRITLHPVLDDGTVDTNVNLYPKTFLDGIVDRDGEEVEVALKDELSNYVTTEDVDQVILGNKRFLHSVEANALKLYNGEDYDTRITGNASGGVSLLSNGEFKTIATVEDIQNLSGYLDFYYSDRQERLVVELQDWMTNIESFEDAKFLSVNGGSLSPYFIEKNITEEGGNISLYSDKNFISLECNGDPQKQDNWFVDASQYFAPESTFEGDELYPAICIDGSEVIEDNVINPKWITNLGQRLESLLIIPTKAWLFTGPDERELVEIYANRGSRDEYIVHIKTSNGEYKLTYQYTEEALK